MGRKAASAGLASCEPRAGSGPVRSSRRRPADRSTASAARTDSMTAGWAGPRQYGLLDNATRRKASAAEGLFSAICAAARSSSRAARGAKNSKLTGAGPWRPRWQLVRAALPARQSKIRRADPQPGPPRGRPRTRPPRSRRAAARTGRPDDFRYVAITASGDGLGREPFQLRRECHTVHDADHREAGRCPKGALHDGNHGAFEAGAASVHLVGRPLPLKHPFGHIVAPPNGGPRVAERDLGGFVQDLEAGTLVTGSVGESGAQRVSGIAFEASSASRPGCLSGGRPPYRRAFRR